ncbi:hypothetical protein [Sphingomonas sediminicola]
MCKARRPLCQECPVNRYCAFFRRTAEQEAPGKR